MKTMKKMLTTLTLKPTLRIWSCKPKNLKRSSKLRATGRSSKRFCFALRIKKMWQLCKTPNRRWMTMPLTFMSSITLKMNSMKTQELTRMSLLKSSWLHYRSRRSLPSLKRNIRKKSRWSRRSTTVLTWRKEKSESTSPLNGTTIKTWTRSLRLASITFRPTLPLKNTLMSDLRKTRSLSIWWKRKRTWTSERVVKATTMTKIHKSNQVANSACLRPQKSMLM